MMGQSRMKREIVLKDGTTRSDSTKTVTGEEQRTSMNSGVVNDATRPKLRTSRG